MAIINVNIDSVNPSLLDGLAIYLESSDPTTVLVGLLRSTLAFSHSLLPRNLNDDYHYRDQFPPLFHSPR